MSEIDYTLGEAISDAQLNSWADGPHRGYANSVRFLRPLEPRVRVAVLREANTFMATHPGFNFSGAVWEAARNVPAGRTPGRDAADAWMAYDPDGTKAAAHAARGGDWQGFRARFEDATPARPADG